jgi:hypothetical protein
MSVGRAGPANNRARLILIFPFPVKRDIIPKSPLKMLAIHPSIP